MNIEWNEVTWYSKLGALILFLIVLPLITFYVGRQYEDTMLVLGQGAPTINSAPLSNNSNVAASSDATLSGIRGMVTLGPTCPVVKVGDTSCADKPYSTNIIVKNSKGKIVTETVSGKDGKFIVTLAPGTYTVEPSKSSSVLPTGETVKVTVTDGTFVKAEMHFDSGIR